ncbi:liprin-beta-1-like protein [Sarcoptes scabiei]|uniref:Liprin-beta-1-like protein n=1 Tax=Sarcoptes scabiei TaxID=52283 RepID=A0A131ZYW3_SARSC|nr:liprin-beta-1-like protein [Sarcoptes scabiei]
METQQKLLKEQNLKLDEELGAVRTRLLEKETEISSLRLTMAKIVRATGYVLSGNELALLREPSSRRESSVGFGGGRFSPIIAANHQPSPLHGSPVQRLFNQSATQHDSSVSSAPKDSEISDKSQPNESLPRSTSFENVKMDSDQSNREILLEDHKSESMKKESADLLDRMEKNSYSTLPHNSKSLRQLRKRFQDEAGGVQDELIAASMVAKPINESRPKGLRRIFSSVNLPFSSWTTNMVADWFSMIGLGMYVTECKRWCKNGEHLMRASTVEVEKDLGIKNALHRKKLRLAVSAMYNEEDDLLKSAGRLDYLWVARWLDDIGLPQYKEAFLDARVDGRILHYLTIEDLLHLKYNGQCLKRRAGMDEVHQTEWNTSEVALWSSHRIMEWLRSIDLSEYAPNLRGSGVHGALILYELAFNADLFATLLSIPTSKSLLRRHISSKFNQLIGEELAKLKQEHQLLPYYQPMIPGSKIKVHRKGAFSLRKKRCDYEITDYVCPISTLGTPTNALISKYSAIRKNRQTKESSTESIQQQITKSESNEDDGNSSRLDQTRENQTDDERSLENDNSTNQSAKEEL